MSRQPRLDIPGLLHHVIFRGIEKCAIVKDDVDRLDFVSRLGRLSQECRIPVYAWALMDNHVHLLVRSSDYGLPRFMRRLLTGHAVTFNLRHKRHGHLFQNRYKSIVCEEESYFLELVRYIHLNSVRAGIVENMAALSTYPWCGHAAVMGNPKLKWQCRDEVLLYFGKGKKKAMAKYEQFIADGLSQGERPELVGGGLRCSQPDLAENEDRPEVYDNRILGGGHFVEDILQQNEAENSVMSLQERKLRGEECLALAYARYSITNLELLSGSRRHSVSAARAIIAVELVKTYGWTLTATARRLGVSPSAISKIVAQSQVG